MILFPFSRDAGRWSYPVAQFFRLSMMVLISSSLHGVRNIFIGQLFFIYVVGFFQEFGFFLSSTGLILEKNVLKWFAIALGLSGETPFILKVTFFLYCFFILLMTSFITNHDLRRFC
jgi:hypothetical protein